VANTATEVATLLAWPRSVADERPVLSRTVDALGQALDEVWPPLRHDDSVRSVSPRRRASGDRIRTTRQRRFGIWRLGLRLERSLITTSPSTAARSAPMADGVVIAPDDNTAQLWDAATGPRIGKALRHADSVNTAVFSREWRARSHGVG
jgi:hypothetical protein